MAKAVYIHIPFCKSICSYCDFCKLFYVKKWASEYFDRLYDEVVDRYEGEKISSIYIGGGTPSILNDKELEKLGEIINLFEKAENCEITFEANLNDLNDIYLTHLKNIGINRLSIGIESFDEANLKLMGREASFDQAKKVIQIARSKGFNNINIDMIYAIPKETLPILKDDVKKALKLNADHISFYSLILEPHTRLSLHYKETVDEDLEYEMYKHIRKSLTKAGFEHYEISNYAKENKKSIHNLTYWHNEEYYGFGVGAVGYFHEVRYENTKNINKYLRREFISKRELVSKDDEKKNELMLRLRLSEGINLNDWFLKYGENLEQNKVIIKLVNKKFLIMDEKSVYINPKKLYIMNEILVKLM